MVLIDINVLLYAHREEAPRHLEYRQWLEGVLGSVSAFGVADLVLSGFLRIATHARVFSPPTPLENALAFVDVIRQIPHRVNVAPGQRHWAIFEDLCRSTRAKGGLIPDAYFAALAIESGSEWITTDLDYARFSGLRWRHPLD